jgi:hypothetical protein
MRKQPHFDDERTVLRARQVVPLQEIEGKVRSRRRWFLGGAFAVAMLLGAASAVISAYFKMRAVPDPEIEPAAVSTVSEEAVLPVIEIAPTRVQPPKTKPRNTDDTAKLTRPRIVIQPSLSEKEDLRRIRDAVLTDEWQERRERRVARREQRRSQHRERDLSNLDEIFEGRRRP